MLAHNACDSAKTNFGFSAAKKKKKNRRVYSSVSTSRINAKVIKRQFRPQIVLTGPDNLWAVVFVDCGRYFVCDV